MESFDINFDNLDPISLDFNDGGKSPSSSSVNFGPGVELLMNNGRKTDNNNVKFDLNELDTLEKELNDLSQSNNNSTTKSFSGISGLDSFSDFTSNLFGFDSNDKKPNTNYQREDINEDSKSNLGEATKNTNSSSKTWDGFSKFNDIPDFKGEPYSSSSNMNDRDKRRKKRIMIKKLEEWYEKGLIKNITHFNIDSSYEEIEDEYESALEDKRLKDSIKLQGWWFMTFVNSVEYANTACNPFDLNLDGWGEQVSEDIDSYEDIFCELHEKYKGGKLSPELSLLLRLGFSAAVVNFTNKALSTATPGFNDVIKQSPELMKMFTNATVSSMSQQSPGFAFANNIANNTDKINTSFGPPPPAMETKNQPNQVRPTMQFTQAPGNRQDINAARGTMFREQGVDMNNNYGDLNYQERSFKQPPPPPPQQTHQQQYQQTQQQQYQQTQQQQYQPQQQQQYQQTQQQQYQQTLSSHSSTPEFQRNVTPNGSTFLQTPRPEMRGPQTTEIDSILSGLKTKNVSEKPQTEPIQMNIYTEDDSMISISSLKEIQNQGMPKRSHKRKNKSDKNTISLDI